MDNDNHQQFGSSEVKVLVDLLSNASKDSTVLARIQRTMIRIVAEDPSSAGMLQQLLEEHYNAGDLDEKSLRLVKGTLDRLVAEQGMTPDEGVPEGVDSYGATTVMADLTALKKSAQTRLQVGSIIQDRYLLKERIASDDMWSVFKAIDRQKTKPDGGREVVAIKVLATRLMANKEALRALQQEVAKGRCLNHQNIGRLLDLVREDDVMFVVAEWLDGKTLAAILDERSGRLFSYEESISIIRQIAGALEYAHRCGVVHGDVRPANIMISPVGTAKLFDFGTARIWQKEFGRVAATRDTGPSVGKPTYASMQVLTGEEPAPADDVFSLANLFYRLIAGYRVFGPRNAAEAAEAGMEPQRPPGLSDSQWKAIKRSLGFSRVARISSPGEFIAALEIPAVTKDSKGSVGGQEAKEVPVPKMPQESIDPDEPEDFIDLGEFVISGELAETEVLSAATDFEEPEERIKPRTIPPLERARDIPPLESARDIPPLEPNSVEPLPIETQVLDEVGEALGIQRRNRWRPIFLFVILVALAGYTFQYKPWEKEGAFDELLDSVSGLVAEFRAAVEARFESLSADTTAGAEAPPNGDVSPEPVNLLATTAAEAKNDGLQVVGDDKGTSSRPAVGETSTTKTKDSLEGATSVVAQDRAAPLSAGVESLRADNEGESMPTAASKPVAAAIEPAESEPVSTKPLARSITIPDYAGEPAANLIIPLRQSGRSNVEQILTLREGGPASVIEIDRGANAGEPLRLIFKEVEYEGSQSPWQSGQYEFSNNGQVEFVAGQSVSRISVAMISDPIREADRSAILELQDPRAVDSSLARLTLNLQDDDQRRFEAGLLPDTIGFAVSQLSVRESDPVAQIDVVRFNPGYEQLLVHYEVRDVTATEGIDYFVPYEKVIYFQPGQRVARLLIPLVQDFDAESDETFTLELIGDSESNSDVFRRIAVTIRDDD